MPKCWGHPDGQWGSSYHLISSTLWLRLSAKPVRKKTYTWTWHSRDVISHINGFIVELQTMCVKRPVTRRKLDLSCRWGRRGGRVAFTNIFPLQTDGHDRNGMDEVSQKDGKPGMMFVQAAVCGSISLTWATEGSERRGGSEGEWKPNKPPSKVKWVPSSCWELITWSITGAFTFINNTQLCFVIDPQQRLWLLLLD